MKKPYLKSSADDVSDDLEARVTAIEVEKRIEDGIEKKIRAICITATGSFLSLCYWLGTVVYNQSYAIQAALKAFWIAKNGGSHE